MNQLADFFIALIELIEAEGRSLRRETVETAFGIALLLFGGIVFAAGAALIGWALYMYLATLMNASLAALVLGVIATVSGGGLVWRIRRNYR